MRKKIEPQWERPIPDDVVQLARLARLLDSALRVPGTPLKIGLDSIIGLIPGIGDAAGAVFSGYIVMKAARLGAPPLTLARMLLNVLIDSIGGVIPVLGDLFDVVWGANVKNVALLESALATERLTPRSTKESRKLFSWIAGVAIFAIFALMVGFGVLVVRLIQSVF